MKSVDDSFLRSLVTRLDNENTIGITLGGSFARGEGGHFSDVDLRQYVRTEPAVDSDFMNFEDDILVSVCLLTLEDEAANLRYPQKAIWAIPGLRQARILLDKDGSIASLIEAAGNVNWHDLQPAANDYASYELCGLVEEVYKILDGLEKDSESKTANATWGLSIGLAKVLLVQRGVFIPTENAFFDLAQSTAGKASNWSKRFRLVIGLDGPPLGEAPYYCRGVAGLRLYQETVVLMQSILRPDDAAVIHRTLEIIATAGY